MAVMAYSAAEIISRAIEIEKKAEQFYKDAATATKDPHVRSVFEMLGGIEQSHVLAFQELEEKLSAEERRVEIYDPGAEMIYYLEQFKEMQAWEMRPCKNLEEKDLTVENVIKAALYAEKETVLFYTFLFDYVPAERGQDRLLVIIREERRHVSMLQNMLDNIEALEKEEKK